MKFIKKNELELANGGYLVFKEGQLPVNHEEFVTLQDEAHYLVSLANKISMTDFTSKQPISFQSVVDNVTKSLNDEKRIFEDELKRFNLIIADDSLLEKEFQKYVEKKKKMYSHYLEPYTQRILHIMHRYKLLPTFLNKRKRLLYLNLIRCESHRDVILRILGN